MAKKPEHPQNEEQLQAPKRNWRDRVNGKPLATLEWGTTVLNVPPSLHRFKSALGLTCGLWLGSEMMKIMTGYDLNGKKQGLDSVHPKLQPLHGKLAYDYHSDNPADRWMKAFHNAVPGVLGALGTYQGSKHFFNKKSKASRNPVYLDEYERRAEMVLGQPWGVASAFSSMFSTVSGFSFLPGPNYGLTLGSRFTTTSGRKVAMPVAGKFWSNNNTIFPYNAPALIDHMIDYAAGNPSENPKQLAAMAQGILAGWFEEAGMEKVDAFVEEVQAVRQEFLREGGVPEEWQAKLKEELKAHFKGAGLEETLEKIGLNPTEAVIGNAGFSGKLAEKGGAGRKMQELRQSYVESYQQRKAEGAKDQVTLG